MADKYQNAATDVMPAEHNDRPDTRELDAGIAAAFRKQDSRADSTSPSVLISLCRKLANVPRVSLRSSMAEGESPIIRPKSMEVPDLVPSSKYQLQGEVARGGMGAIIKGRDTDLGRDLAVKVLLDSHRDKPEVVQRFIEEAQIGGQLQHPGIVPVYELGEFPDQRPFFTMKLVKGKTLGALISERESPLTDRARFLGIFEQACQAISYAHSRGVIHRDLKPANVMVGAFGEVQVMDWGLAKVLAQGGIADEQPSHGSSHNKSVIHTNRSRAEETLKNGGSNTQAGSVLGTPAYMPPEQAVGEIDRLDERADVFGLGALLCEILTGQPPYIGPSHKDVFRMASRGQLDPCFQRLDKCEADDVLVQIARDCLASEPEQRPRNASVLANRLTKYMDSVQDRMRQAELDRIEATTKAAEERKRRRVTLALACSVLVSFVMLAGAVIWGLQERGQLNERISGELATARALGGEDGSGVLPDGQSLSRAISAAERADSLLVAAKFPVDGALARQVVALQDVLQVRKRDQQLMDELEEIWEWEIEQLAYRQPPPSYMIATSTEAPDPSLYGTDYGIADSAKRYEAAFAKWGLSPNETDQEEALARIRALPEAFQAPVFVSVDRWRNMLSGRKSAEQWKKEQWSVLRLDPTKSRNRGGDKLNVLPDSSVLVTGEHPKFGNDFVFETDETTISALRLEAMTHESLPNGGPSRSSTGACNLMRLEVHIAPRATPALQKSVAIRSAAADLSHPVWPLATDFWFFDGAGSNQSAFFEFAETVHSDSGFIVSVVNGDGGSSRYGRQTIGRFRWSVSSSAQTTQTVDRLAKLTQTGDEDEWRQALREEMAQGDVTALIERADNHQAAQHQPKIALIQLAETLQQITDLQLLNSQTTMPRWEVLKPADVKSNLGATFTVHEDGVVEPSGPALTSETISIAVPIHSKDVGAIRLELLPTLTREARVADRRNSMRAVLHEFRASIVAGASVNEVPVPVQRVISNRGQSTTNTGLDNLIDGNADSAFQVPSHMLKDHEIFFLTGAELPVEGGMLRVQIVADATQLHGKNLGRFRLSNCDNMARWPDPRQAALTLLRRMHATNPGDYWLNLALAGSLINGKLTDAGDAFRYATAALAMRPDAAAPNGMLQLCLPSQNLVHDPVQQEVFAVQAKRAQELDVDAEILRRGAEKYIEQAKQLIGRSKPDVQTHLELAVTVGSRDAEVLVSVGNIYLYGLHDRKRAIAAFRSALELSPKDYEIRRQLAESFLLEGMVEDALREFRSANEVNHGWRAFWVSAILTEQGKPEEGLQEALRLMESTGHTTFKGAEAFALLELNRIDEAVAAFRTAIAMDARYFPAYGILGVLLKKQGKSAESREMLAKASAILKQFEKILEVEPSVVRNLGYVLDAQGKTAEAIEYLTRKMEVYPHHPAGEQLAFMLATAEDESLRDPKRAVEFAQRACDRAPRMPRNWITLGIAQYRDGEFKSAVESLQKATTMKYAENYNGWFFLAMSLEKSGDHDGAVAAYKSGLDWTEKHFPKDEELARFRGEAAKVLGLK